MLSAYQINRIIDAVQRGQSGSIVWPTTTYYALATTEPTEVAPGTEVGGASYARQAVPVDMNEWAGTQGAGTTVASSGTSGITSNNNPVDFGTAAEAWGTVGWWMEFDSLSGGNMLSFGTITDSAGVATPRSINAGDPVLFPAGALQHIWV